MKNFIDIFVKSSLTEEEVNIADFNEDKLYLPTDLSVKAGLLSFLSTPYQRQMLEIISDKKITDVAIMSSAQIGKTNILLYLINYYILKEPCNILIVEPTEDLAKSFSTEKLSPIIKSNPILQKSIYEETIFQKLFFGGSLNIVSSKSPSSLSMRSIRVVLQDEIDSYVIGREGNPSELADKRTQTYRHKAKRIKVSTPKKDKGLSWIEEEIKNSNLYKFFVNCLGCQKKFIPTFELIKWDKKQRVDKNTGEIINEYLYNTAKLHCPICEHKHNQLDVIKIGRKGKFELVQKYEDKSKVGFHLNQIISPFSDIIEIANSWGKSKNDQESVRSFKNLVLGETFEPVVTNVKIFKMMDNRAEYPELPEQVDIITCGVDCQKDRVECDVVGWDKDKEISWQLDYRVIWGNLHDSEIWQNLEKYLATKWGDRKIDCTFIDSGNTDGLTQSVYEFTKYRQYLNIYAIKGKQDSFGATRPILPNKPTMINDTPLFILGSYELKQKITYHLSVIDKNEAGYCFFRPERNEDYFKMFTKDYLVKDTRNGKVFYSWKQRGGNNEAFDCRQYAYAAFLFAKQNGIFYKKSSDIDTSINLSF